MTSLTTPRQREFAQRRLGELQSGGRSIQQVGQSLVREPLNFATETPATTSINRETAPTAAPVGAPSLDKNQVDIFNNALMSLLTKSQGIGAGKFREREENLRSEGLARVGRETTGDDRFLSPTQQQAIRSSGASAVGGAEAITRANRLEFERKTENIPALLSSLQGFAESFKDTSGELVSQTFEKDDAGNITFIGRTKGGKIITENVGRFGTTSKSKKGIGGGLKGTTGNAAIDNLSALSRQTLGSPSLLDSMTPTRQGDIMEEIANAGISLEDFNSVIGAEDEQSVRTIQKGLGDVMEKWKAVPNKFKGILQGRVAEKGFLGFAPARETNVEVAEFDASQKIVGQQLTRLFEKGRLSDADRLFYQARMPNLNQQNEKVAQATVDTLITTLETQLKDLRTQNANKWGLSSSGVDSGQTDKDPLDIR